MMIGLEQIRRGAMTYVTRELTPLMPAVKGALVEAFAPAVIDANLRKYVGKEWLEGTGFVEGNTVNVDELYRLFKLTASPKWPMEIVGFKFSEADLDKLINYIREG